MIAIKELLRELKSDEVREAEILLAHLLKKDHSFVVSHGEKTIDNATKRRFDNFIKRRRVGEPLAYLLGYHPFYGLTFTVNRHVLIPRPESEWLVEKSIEILRRHRDITMIVDVGTGGGCLIISILKNQTPAKKRQIIAYGTDISSTALIVAKRNAKLHNVTQIKFLHGDLLKPLEPKLMAYGLRLTAQPIILLANLPYLTTDDYRRASPSVKKFEPKNALAAGQDGLKYYRRLVKQLSKFINIEFRCIWEIDPCHSQKLKKLVQKTFPKSRPQLYKDYNNLDRYLTATITP
ncbi:protein-(glutamine-N5) methyltransferase, release factor-specific [Candidatus Uhrbacteria bacterium RIFCSPLOWO2_12_FULL_46_10]|uniref:Protein-(Glutamine-N5) methyltransferase, release factor-specific n=1 Tax=Candidatus Uhrbacteria bacterium RIFCSPLOWO2_01_FULL_47_25 TaxID=1802402 RepID=A0A1F7UY71_9BACT|nr:MAG: Release factor glutamine methyltransferase [Parcubacteria group bacterium GW2011_GWA2_46_9]OGL60183.1 MAG: protein-(glutamine-N5) methyltransferase, release factor-specific [Candidatus Uhrbacteria bacterium RIFCSPHIGHO2_01_FULL_46_23]OGL69647.1 MAG: protein-(glutamine-N5) methyltransferase, release factor-specific [Candidatus Uhrbacteria bacterium RIFCSPHIGHO2_02_FULL_47_29]OGL75877.1 MAG: protein-(glutamine-N5) methyltransferase, release factor-specific [Candidatus Uhrbacteria bacterium